MKDHEPRRLVLMRPKHCGRGVAMYGQKEHFFRAVLWRVGGHSIIFLLTKWGSGEWVRMDGRWRANFGTIAHVGVHYHERNIYYAIRMMS